MSPAITSLVWGAVTASVVLTLALTVVTGAVTSSFVTVTVVDVVSQSAVCGVVAVCSPAPTEKVTLPSASVFFV